MISPGFKTSHVLPALIRKFHLAKLLEQGDIEGIKKDFKKYPIGFGLDKEVDFNNDESIIKVLSKLGIKSEKINPTFNINNPSSNIYLEVWGSGEVYREFLYVDDLADACVYLMENVNAEDILSLFSTSSPLTSYPSPLTSHISPLTDYFVNIGTGIDIKIKDLADLIRDLVGFKGEIKYDLTKPDGTPRKLLDVSKIKQLGWEAKIGLEEGIKRVYEEY